MTGAEILAEADERVPNAFTTDQKARWLDDVHREFFEVVKVPATVSASVLAGQSQIPLPADARGRNITLVLVAGGEYRPLAFDDSYRPGLNYYVYDETMQQLVLNPPAPIPGTALVRYFRVPTVAFNAANLSVEPEVPEAYQHVLVLGVCMHIAKAQNDIALANNYTQEYTAALQVAQHNHGLFNTIQGLLDAAGGGRR